MYHDVLIVLGSKTDESVLEESGALTILRGAALSYSVIVRSAHRHEKDLIISILDAQNEGTRMFWAVAGKSAPLAAKIAAEIQGVIVLGIPLDESARISMLDIPRSPKIAHPVIGTGKTALANAAYWTANVFQLFGTKKQQEVAVDRFRSLCKYFDERNPPEDLGSWRPADQ